MPDDEKFPDKEPDTHPEGPLVRCPLCLGEGRVLETIGPDHHRARMCGLCGGRCWVSKTVYARWVRKRKHGR